MNRDRRHWATIALCVAASACRGAPPAPSPITPVPRLYIAESRHDFGTAGQGEQLHWTAEIENRGTATLTLESESQALGCRATPVPATLPPGAKGRLEVTCQADYFGPLRVTLPLPSNAPKADNQLTLLAEITARLNFDTPLLEFEMPIGEERSADVHLIGMLADRAKIQLKDGGDAGFEVAISGGPKRSSGLHVTAKPKRVGVFVGNLVFTTNLAPPSELSLPYSCKVLGTLEVNPTTPYFDLSVAGPKQVTVVVRSAQPRFAVRAVRVLEGPFSATFQHDPETAQYHVTIRVREDQLWDQARSALGRLEILSNDRSEPRKELPLFGFGARNRSAAP